MQSPDESVQDQSLSLFNKIVMKHPEAVVDQISDTLFSKIVDLMSHKKSSIHQTALRFVSQCFSSESTRLINTGLERGVLQNYQNLLLSTSTALIKESLWGISNITAGTLSHIAAFLNEEMLLNRVLVLMTHSNQSVKTEAIYVVCNFINSPSIESDWLRQLFEKRGFQIVQPLCKALEDRNLDADVLVCGLQALSVLL